MSTVSPFVDFRAGEVILREGEVASALYIIDTGDVAVAAPGAPGRVVAELGPGDFFGEMAILQEQAHSANVTATSAVRALRIDAAAFPGVLRENAEIAVQMLRRLVMRLQASEQRAATAPAEAGAPAAGRVPSASAPAEPASAASASASSPPTAPPPPPTETAATARPAEPAIALLLRHGSERIAVPAGKTELLVGRPDPATGAIPELNLGPFDAARTLSRRHARLLLADGRWMLREEPGVANGTWLNGERLQAGQTVTVKAGDTLRFGAIELELLRD